MSVAIGNAHGIYHSKPKLNINRLKEIRELTNVPLVLHGGSGLTKDQIQNCIAFGVAKVNIGTELKPPYIKGIIDHLNKFSKKDLTDSKMNDPRFFLKESVQNIKEVAKEKIILCKSNDKYPKLKINC